MSGGRRRAALLQLGSNYAGIAISMIKGLVLVPLIVSHLGLETYGAWLASGNLIMLVSAVEGGLGLAFGQ